ncbi:MAG: glycosyltransferase family 9 protein [Deltaproteobacteria bacterium]|nr:glycosyltransferase family 9 protein [Deltaproteobacteria bacterium]
MTARPPPYARVLRGREKYLLRTRIAEPLLGRTIGRAGDAWRSLRHGPVPLDATPPERLLVVHRIRIGDAIVITPLLRALRARFPSTEVVLVVSPVVADLMERAEGVDRVVPFTPVPGEGTRRAAARAAALVGPAGQACMAFVLDFTRLSVAIARKAGAGVRVGYDDHGRGFDLTHTLPWPVEWARATADYPVGTEPRHQAEHWLALGALVGAEVTDAQPRLRVDRSAEWEKLLPGAGFSGGDRVVVVHPGSDSSYRWRSERWAEVANSLATRHGLRVVISGGPEDASVLDAMRARLAQKAPDLLHAGLVTALDVAARAVLVLSVDTCMAHIASAAGTPAVVLSGPADPRMWRPYGPQHIVVSDPEARCGGCKLPRCPIREHLCMDGISTAEVLAAAERILGAGIVGKTGSRPDEA